MVKICLCSSAAVKGGLKKQESVGPVSSNPSGCVAVKQNKIK